MSTEKPTSILEHTGSVNIVIRVAVEHERKYLMVQESKPHCYGKWSFPGGKLDMGEFLAAAAVREVYEETQVRVQLTGILGIRQGPWEDIPGTTLAVAFTAKVVELPSTFPVSSEILTVEWKTPEEIAALAAEDNLRNRAQEAMLTLLRTGRSLPMSHLVEMTSFAVRNS